MRSVVRQAIQDVRTVPPRPLAGPPTDSALAALRRVVDGRVAASARTNESRTDYSQLSGTTQGGTTYDLVYAVTDNSERTKLGSTCFHHTALGLASTTTNGVDTGFIREPGAL